MPGAPISYFRIAAEHESNGKDGPNTRSLNIVYVEPKLAFGLGNDGHIILNARAWLYAGTPNDNTDIQDFEGTRKLVLAPHKRVDSVRWRTSVETREPGRAPGC